jgi:uncharacterized membrane protein
MPHDVGSGCSKSAPPTAQDASGELSRLELLAVRKMDKRRCWRGHAVWLLLPLLAFPAEAHADLKLCNSTSSRIGVAVGYQDATGWATEGWWNIASQTCETLLKGAVPSRFIYVHALDYDRGGEWVGTNFMCTDDKSFAIRGVQDCLKRGFKRTGFFEVDTGESQEWTIRLTDPEASEK